MRVITFSRLKVKWISECMSRNSIDSFIILKNHQFSMVKFIVLNRIDFIILNWSHCTILYESFNSFSTSKKNNKLKLLRQLVSMANRISFLLSVKIRKYFRKFCKLWNYFNAHSMVYGEDERERVGEHLMQIGNVPFLVDTN